MSGQSEYSCSPWKRGKEKSIRYTTLSDNGTVFSKASNFFLGLGVPVPDLLVMVSLEMQEKIL